MPLDGTITICVTHVLSVDEVSVINWPHVVYGMGQELLFWKLKNLNKLLVFEALYP